MQDLQDLVLLCWDSMRIMCTVKFMEWMGKETINVFSLWKLMKKE